MVSIHPDDDPVTGYEILGELGRGGMGVVYKARQRALNRLVALKMVLSGAHAGPADYARFRAEAEVVARLQHPHIVQIYEIGEQDGRPFLALELVDGTTLQKKVAGTPQPARPAAHLVETLARAVHSAHQRGVVHRDLKPANVLLAAPLQGLSDHADPDAARVAALFGVPKVTDFGLAKRLEDDGQQTRSGDILGTPSYMAPEQAAGRAGEAGPAADVYALGAILYDLLTGRPPFKGATALETLQQALHDDPIPPGRLRPKLPKDLERICLKCLEKDPRRRYASALDLADDLRRHLNGESVRARPAPPHERLWRWSRRNPVPASLLVAITLGAAFGFWHLSRLSRSLVRASALEGAAQQAETMEELNKYYSGVVVAGLRKTQVPGGHGTTTADKLVPPPATMTIELGQQITTASETGMQVRLYSDHPFAYRKDGGPRDEFEREALERLRQSPKEPYYRFEEVGGNSVLRYATARVMAAGCVQCHNTHPDSTKQDWKEGDVRGVLEITRPLHRDEERIHSGLRDTVLLMGGTGVSLLGVTAGLLVLGRRRRLPPASSPAPRPENPTPDAGADTLTPAAAGASVPDEVGPTLTPSVGSHPVTVAGDTPQPVPGTETLVRPVRTEPTRPTTVVPPTEPSPAPPEPGDIMTPDGWLPLSAGFDADRAGNADRVTPG